MNKSWHQEKVQGNHEKLPKQQSEPPLHGSAQSTPKKGGEHERKNSTCQQWLRWLSKQVSGVADQLEEEESRREHLIRTMKEELVSVRAQMQSVGEELTRAKENAVSMDTKGQQSNVDTEPVVTTKQKATPEPELLKSRTESAQEIKTLREELAA